MQDDDLDVILKWRNHPSIRNSMFSHNELDFNTHYLWYQSAKVNPDKHLLIFESASEPLGFVSFSRCSYGDVFDWSFFVAPNMKKGTGTTMCQLAINYAFDTLGLHKICGRVISFNSVSIALHEKLGFTREGLLRKHYLRSENYYDVLCFGLLR